MKRKSIWVAIGTAFFMTVTLASGFAAGAKESEPMAKKGKSGCRGKNPYWGCCFN